MEGETRKVVIRDLGGRRQVDMEKTLQKNYNYLRTVSNGMQRGPQLTAM